VACSPTGRPATASTITAGITDGHEVAAGFRGGCGLGETLTATLHPFLCAGIWAGWAKQALAGHSRSAGPRAEDSGPQAAQLLHFQKFIGPPKLSKSPEKPPEL
jgi:hypothetical protein